MVFSGMSIRSPTRAPGPDRGRDTWPSPRSGLSAGEDAVLVLAVELEGASRRLEREGDRVVARGHGRVGASTGTRTGDSHHERRIGARADAVGRERDTAGVVPVSDLLQPGPLYSGQRHGCVYGGDRHRLRRRVAGIDGAAHVVARVIGSRRARVAWIDRRVAHGEGRGRSKAAGGAHDEANRHCGLPGKDHDDGEPRVAPAGGTPPPSCCLTASNLATSTGETKPARRPLSKTRKRGPRPLPTLWSRAASSP